MKCYFNLANRHQSIADDIGVEVADVDEVRALALEAAAEMIQAGEAQIADWRGWRLEAADTSGAVVFTISLDALLS